MSQSLNIIIDWEVPQKIIFNALLDQMEVCKYTRGSAIVERKVGGQFNMYDGKIQGTFTEINEETFTIKSEWKFAEWNTFSKVEITFKDRDDECQMTMKQTDIPSSQDLNTLKNGWENQIFKAMSIICGFPIDE